MSIRFWNWVWAQEELTSFETLVLLCLADMADDEGTSFPSIKTLAKRCRTSERTIQRCIAVLKKKGMVQVRARIIGGQQSSNYFLLMADSAGANSTKGSGDKGSPGDTAVTPTVTAEALTGDSDVTRIVKSNRQDNHDGGAIVLEFPTCIDSTHRDECLAKLSGITLADAQLVLDELAARRELTPIADPVAYLSKLVQACKRSKFDPTLAIAYRAKQALAVERQVACEKERAEQRVRRSRINFDANAIRLNQILSTL
jgi:hypothetical protein